MSAPASGARDPGLFRRRSKDRATGEAANATAEELQRRTSQIAQYLEMLPPDRLPYLRAAQDLFDTEEDAQSDGLRNGLEMLLDGLLTRPG